MVYYYNHIREINMTENDSINKIKNDIKKQFKDKTWFFENPKYPCKKGIMFIAERPSTAEDRKIKRSYDRLYIFYKLKEKYFPNSYVTDCIKIKGKNMEFKTIKYEKDFKNSIKFLIREIKCLRPSVIVFVGNQAEYLVKSNDTLKKLVKLLGIKLDKIMHYAYAKKKGYSRLEDFKTKYDDEFRKLKQRIIKVLL
jgi:uracil-DNA glycosylase